MAVKVRTAWARGPSGTAQTRQFTIPNFDEPVKGVYLRAVIAETATPWETPQANKTFMHGATDGVSTCYASEHSQDGVASVNSSRSSNTGNMLAQLRSGSSTLLRTMDFVQFITNGFEATFAEDWVDVWIQFTLFGGSDVSCVCDFGIVGGGGRTVTAGFPADYIRFMGVGTQGGSTSQSAAQSGMCIRLPAIDQAGMADATSSGTSPTNAPRAWKESGLGLINMNTGSDSNFSRAVQITAIGATTYDLGLVAGSSGSALYAGTFAVGFNGAAGVELVRGNKWPATTGNYQIPFSFPVQHMEVLTGTFDADGAQQNTGALGSIGLAVIESDFQGSVQAGQNRGLATVDAKSHVSNTRMYIPAANHANGVVGGLASISGSGVTLNLVSTEPDWYYLAVGIEGDADLPVDVSPDDVASASPLSEPTITVIVDTAPDDVASLSPLAEPVITPILSLAVDDVDSVSPVSVPSLDVIVLTAPDDLDSLSPLSTPTIDVQPWALEPAVVESLSPVSQPAMTFVPANAAPADVDSESPLQSPSIAIGVQPVTVDSIESASSLFSPEVFASFVIDDLESLSELAESAIIVESPLSPDDMASLSPLDQPSITYVDANVTPGDLDSASLLASPIVNTDADTVPDPIDSQTSVDGVTIGIQAGNAAADDVDSVSELESPGLLIGSAVFPDGLDSVSDLASPAVGVSVETVTVDDVASASIVTDPAMTYVPAQIFPLTVESESPLTQPNIFVGNAAIPDAVESVSPVSEPAITFVAAGILPESLASASPVSAAAVTDAGLIAAPPPGRIARIPGGGRRITAPAGERIVHAR